MVRKMKKRMMIGMAAAMVMAVTPTYAEEAVEMTGTYEAYTEEGMPEDAMEAFEKAMENFEGADNYTALQLVETQIVAGMNYRILCDVQEQDDIPAHKQMVTIYKDLDGNCEVLMEQKVITPKNQMFDKEAKDFTTKAGFEAQDINWEDQTLTIDLYQDTLYDMVDMTRMECGSVVAIDGLYITVETIDESEVTRITDEGSEELKAVRTINKDMGDETVFVANEGGTWISVGPDDLISITKVGEGTYPISDQCVLTDVGDSPSENVEIAFDELQSYLKENKAAMGNHFSSYNTFVEVADGKIVSIKRNYRP